MLTIKNLGERGKFQMCNELLFWNEFRIWIIHPDILHQNLPNAVFNQQNNPNLGDQGIFTIPNESRIWIIQTPFKTYQDLENSVVLASTKC